MSTHYAFHGYDGVTLCGHHANHSDYPVVEGLVEASCPDCRAGLLLMGTDEFNNDIAVAGYLKHFPHLLTAFILLHAEHEL